MANTLVPPDRQRYADDRLWREVFQFYGVLTGAAEWGVPVSLSSFNGNSTYSVTIRNLGTGGHLRILKSTDASELLLVTDSGVTLGTLAVSGNVTVGGQIISTLANGTAPIVVTSQTLVTNLNADRLDSQDGTYYLARANHTGTQAPATISPQGAGSGLDADLLDGLSSASFALLSGAAFTGNVTVAGTFGVTGASTLSTTTVTGAGAGNDQSLFLQHGAGDGLVSIGAENAAAPDLIIKNNAGTQIGRFTNEGLLIAGDATAAVSTAGAADVQCQDLWLVDGANYRRLLANGSTFFLSRNADGANSDVTVDSAGTLAAVRLVANAAGLDGSEELLVNGQSRLKGQVVVTTGGVDVTGNSTFASDVTFNTSTLFVSAGSSTVGIGTASPDSACVVTLNGLVRFDGTTASGKTATGDFLQIKVGSNTRWLALYQT